MKCGVMIRTMGPQSTREIIQQCAQSAEQLGFDSLILPDHLCIPPDETEGSGGRYLEVLITLGFLAGVTERIRLGLGVLVMPYRPPILIAKQIATAQELSGERVILGAGAGWLRGEFAALGLSFERRGKLTNEALATLIDLFDPESNPAPGVKGPFVFSPRPARPPIWVGGHSPAAIERALRYGDGWYPMLGTGKIGPAVAQIQREAQKRVREPLQIIAGMVFSPDAPDQTRVRLDELAQAGVDYVIAHFGRYADADEFARAAEIFMRIAQS
jgi:probable F420-dependent oxidoreductase